MTSHPTTSTPHPTTQPTKSEALVRITLNDYNVINLAEIKIYTADGTLMSVDGGDMSSMLSGYPISNCYDGLVNDGMCHTDPTKKTTEYAWVEVFISSTSAFSIGSIVVENRRNAGCCKDRIVGATLSVFDTGALLWNETFVSEQLTYTFTKPDNVTPSPSLSPTLSVAPSEKPTREKTCFVLSMKF
jgi:hypothetical protein